MGPGGQDSVMGLSLSLLKDLSSRLEESNCGRLRESQTLITAFLSRWNHVFRHKLRGSDVRQPFFVWKDNSLQLNVWIFEWFHDFATWRQDIHIWWRHLILWIPIHSSSKCQKKRSKKHREPVQIRFLHILNKALVLQRSNFSDFNLLPWRSLILTHILPKANIFAPENRPGPKKLKAIFQPIYFHGRNVC